MNWTVVLRILGLLLMIFSLTMLLPIFWSWWFEDDSWLSFIESFAVTFSVGLLVWFPVRRSRRDLRLRDGFVVVAAFWIVLGLFGSLLIWIEPNP